MGGGGVLSEKCPNSKSESGNRQQIRSTKLETDQESLGFVLYDAAAKKWTELPGIVEQENAAVRKAVVEALAFVQSDSQQGQ
jgi:hypothetical protein